MVRQFSLVWATLLVGFCPATYADQADGLPPAAKTQRHRLNHTDAPGADRWCILAFIENSRHERYLEGPRPSQPPSAIYRTPAYSLSAAPPTYTDATSLMSRPQCTA